MKTENRTLVQGSEEWYRARLGKITASCFHKVMTKPRSGGGMSQTALTYMRELIGERLTGQPADEIHSKYLDHGNKYEPVARAMYLATSDRDDHKVELIGFFDHPSLPWVGGSPDMLVDDDGIGEIKCPYTTKNHIEFLELDEITEKSHKPYFWQCQGNMWLSNRHWMDFVSFHPGFPKPLQLKVMRLQRDDDAYERLEEEMPRFLQQTQIKLLKMIDPLSQSERQSLIDNNSLDTPLITDGKESK